MKSIMKKALFIIAATLAFTSAIQAKQLGIGLAKNHTSNGILFTYTPTWKDKWAFDLGLRVTVNTNDVTKDEQYSSYYQAVYANTFPEFFSLNFRIDRKIFRYKWIRLGFMSNLHLTCESMLSRIKSYKQNPNTQEWEQFDDVLYVKPSPAIELTIGPQLTIDIHKKLTLNATVGFGIIYMHHSHEAWSRLLQEKVYIFNTSIPNWKRGAYEYVSTDKLSMISFGMKYKLK
jgi:hypothetical protein